MFVVIFLFLRLRVLCKRENRLKHVVDRTKTLSKVQQTNLDVLVDGLLFLLMLPRRLLT